MIMFNKKIVAVAISSILLTGCFSGDDDAVADVVQATATVLGRYSRAESTHVTKLLHDLRWEVRVLRPLFDVRRNFFLHIIAYCFGNGLTGC